MREFESGATRDDDTNKLDFEAFLSPAVLFRYAAYMNKHRTRSDGTLRDGDDWQKGMPLDVYMKSAVRHMMEWWSLHRDALVPLGTADMEDAMCGVLFNTMGYLHEMNERVSNGESD